MIKPMMEWLKTRVNDAELFKAPQSPEGNSEIEDIVEFPVCFEFKTFQSPFQVAKQSELP